MVNVLIPVRFYGFDSIMYMASALIGFLISYYAHKLFRITSQRYHFYLYFGFTVLSIGFLILALTSSFTYINYFAFGQLPIVDRVPFVDDFGFWVYYAMSLVAYGMFAFMYLSEDLKSAQGMKLPIFLPVWYSGFPYFHILSILFLSYVVFRNLMNFVSKKNINSFLVFLGFGAIGMYHFFLFFTSFSKLMYVLAHFSLIFGFMSLLAMLIRVTRK